MITAPMNYAGPVRLVVFDLGRVLIRICNAWFEAFDRAGVPAPMSRGDLMAAGRLRQLLDDAELGRITWDDFSEQAASLMKCSIEQVHAVSAAFLRDPYPGAAELLAELSVASVVTACLSNTNAHHWGLLSEPACPAYFPLDRFTHRFASHLLGTRKPDEAIYVRLEEETGVASGSILFFDDRQENIQAAARRGWRAHWIDPDLNDPLPQIRAALRRHRVTPAPAIR